MAGLHLWREFRDGGAKDQGVAPVRTKLDKFRIQDARAFGKVGTIMLADWKDRIGGIKRIVTAFGVMRLCTTMGENESIQAVGAAVVDVLRT